MPDAQTITFADRLSRVAAMVRAYDAALRAENSFEEVLLSCEDINQPWPDIVWGYYLPGPNHMLHVQDLQEMKVCGTQLDLYWEVFPSGASLTAENFELAISRGLNVPWFVEQIRPSWAEGNSYTLILPDSPLWGQA